MKKEEAGSDDVKDATTRPPAVYHEPGKSIPLLVLQHAADSNLDVTVGLSTSYRYRGRLVSFDDEMNLTLRDVTVTKPNLKNVHASATVVGHMADVFVRGAQVVDIVLPSSLQPEFELKAKAFKRYFNNAVKVARGGDKKKKAKSAEDTSRAAKI